MAAVHLLSILLLLSIGLPASAADGDRPALLSFLLGIRSLSQRSLLHWTSPDICNWTGVSCHRTLPQRVLQLDLSCRGLIGSISPAIVGLSFLQVLDLSNNLFSGEIPPELGFLTGLKELTLSSNLLSGTIPPQLSFLAELVYLDLSGNQLAGHIPDALFCNSSNLQYVDLSNNSLAGEIPIHPDSRLNELRFLFLWSNVLEGPIPPSISNSSKLEGIDLKSNYLSGRLPVNLFGKLPSLQFLYLSYNYLSAAGNLDAFLRSLSNCSRMRELELAGNDLVGEIPPSVGLLSVNFLQIHFEENRLTGQIPANISNLVNLTYLNLSNNALNGSIPPDISRLQRLERLYLSNNKLAGDIPQSFGEMPHLGLLDISGNILSGTIPNSFAELRQLRQLLLHGNRLSGNIPHSLGFCNKLEVLDLSHNQLSGSIPAEVASLRSLKFYLNLSSNHLSGPLPPELSKMDMILAMDLSSNHLSGDIPPQLGSCAALEYLNLSSNSLHGQLPGAIGALSSLKVLDLSSNQLAGSLPVSLQASSTLQQLNLSVNNLSGVIPDNGVFASLSGSSFAGNPLLCGHIAGVPSCSKPKRDRRRAVVPILLFAVIGTPCLVFFAVGYPIIRRKRSGRLKFQLPIFHRVVIEHSDEAGNLCSSDYPRISYRQLVEATGGFSDEAVIGSGRFGRVYRGDLRNGTQIAVKILDLNAGGAGEASGSFKRECEVLRRTRHRNLIKIITACSRPDFKALVLPLMPNGNLEQWLYRAKQSPELQLRGMSLETMVRVGSDVAEGMAYLHHYSPVRVVHCDLKPSNVLLDGDMTAVVSDFGIARLVKRGGNDGGCGGGGAGDVGSLASCISTAGLLHGSVGYIAPEYGLGGHPSIHGDVYSFGVLLLEMITGKRPTDVVFHEGLTLQEWVRSHYPDSLHAVVPQDLTLSTLKTLADSDPFSFRKMNVFVITELVELGLSCSQHSPSLRPSMADVAHEMAVLKQELSRLSAQEASSFKA
ncbi:Putative leucine-rich repeat receptor-like serine/threonine-protein kinase [Apostasia shenzhenica]|uniref:non-specific serine/threonine protein kinase n=1 Tax=Apostasia shenzhenica TaxID=1088818 RepID=A0A2I0A0Z4_9ASPA|nr:Putative leucine-rich repeat receptor-like serine/threonine-protein kinase [Apostasia shenzhenica]